MGADFGLKIKNKDIMVSDIINALEDMEKAPKQVKEYYPDITDEEWQASTRVSTLVFLLFEKYIYSLYEKYKNEEYKNEEYKKAQFINNRMIVNNM